jgi:hypothetical protein
MLHRERCKTYFVGKCSENMRVPMTFFDRKKKYFIWFEIFIILCTLNLASCSLTPIAIDGGAVYVGGFKASKEVTENCMYSEIEGVGFKLGFTHFSSGIGYFERKSLVVTPGENVNCYSVIADVYLGKAAVEKATKIDIQ